MEKKSGIMPISLYWFQKEAIRKVEESWGKGNKSPLISVPTGGGKCVSAESLIWTNKGIFGIGELADEIPPNMAAVRKNLYVEARDRTPNCSLVYHSSHTHVLKLKTVSGYEIHGTPEHPILFKTDKGLVMKRLEEAKKGELAVLKKGFDLWATLPLISRVPGANIPHIMDSVTAEIYRLAEAIAFNVMDLKSLPEEYDSVKRYIRNIDEVPSVILRSGKEFVLAFLRSFFSRACLHTNIGFETIHKKLAKQIQVLLLSLGIPSMQTITNSAEKAVMYHVIIDSDYEEEFIKIISFTDNFNDNFLISKNANDDKFVTKDRFIYKEVVDITDDYASVYDLTVPDGHEFIANGFVSHNTIIFSSVLKNSLKETRKRGLILVHRDSLLTQAAEKLKFVWPEVQIGRVQGGVYDYGKQITIASVQTLVGKLDEFNKVCAEKGKIDFIVCDEAHHAYATTWRKTIDFFKNNQSSSILGVTATPIRTSKKESLSSIFDDVPYVISIFQLIHEGFLSPIVGYSIETSLNLKGVGIKNGDYDVKELSQRIRHSNFDENVAKIWKERSGDRKSICFAVDIEHVESLVEEFKRIGAKVVGIHGKLPREEQRKILADYSTGVYNVMVNCQILTEGFDEPSVNCVLMARPTSSRALYIQMLGRGVRLSPGKKDCLLLDFTANSEMNSMITMQDLLGFYGLNRAERLYKERLSSNEDNGNDEPFIISPETIPSLTALDKFGEEFETSGASKEIDVFDINKFAWEKLDENLFVSVRRNLSLAICESDVKSDDGRKKFVPYLVFTEKPDKWMCPLSEPVDKEFAQAIANVQIFDYGDRNLACRHIPWRSESPSPSQKQVLSEAVERYNKISKCKVSISDIPVTKGDYSSMITSLFTYSYIKNNVKKIPLEEAIAKLKTKVIEEISGPNPKNKSKKFAIEFLKEYAEQDKQAVIDMIMALQNVKYAEFPIEFLTSNPIEISGNVVRVHKKNYPAYPLSNKQREFLMDKITLVFRLYFKDKSFEIRDLSIKKVSGGI